MSRVRTSSKPASRATCSPPTTPPAGPDSTIPTARRRAVSAATVPPLDCMTRKRRTGSSRSSFSRYRSTTGAR
jgi:hypothetical protein